MNCLLLYLCWLQLENVKILEMGVENVWYGQKQWRGGCTMGFGVCGARCQVGVSLVSGQSLFRK